MVWYESKIDCNDTFSFVEEKGDGQKVCGKLVQIGNLIMIVLNLIYLCLILKIVALSHFILI